MSSNNNQGVIQEWLQAQIILKMHFVTLVYLVELNILIEN